MARGRLLTGVRGGLRCWLACGALLLSSLALSSNVAAESGSKPKFSGGFVFDLRTFSGGAALNLSATTQSGRTYSVVGFDAIAGGAAVRAGTDLSAYFQIGATASVAQYWRAGKFHVHDAQKFGDTYFQFDDTPTLWSPLGLFMEIHPWKEAGPFVGLDLSLGYLPGVANPRPGTIDMPMYMAGYALEIGYEPSRSRPHSFGAFLRFSAWSGGESILSTDFPEGLSLAALTIGARWAFRP